MQIKSLTAISIDELYFAFSKAFSDYSRSWTKTEFEKMLRRRGYAEEVSFGVFTGGELISFALNGIGDFKGMTTAYDTGTGTVEAFRGKGLATQLFQHAFPLLKQQGVQRYLLEVLTDNEKAIGIYKRLGFVTSRELNYFISEKKAVLMNAEKLREEIGLRSIDLSMQSEMMKMWDCFPSWQNSFDAIARNAADFKLTGAFLNNELIGYGIIEPATGDIPQLAVHKAERRKGIGSALLNELINHNASGNLKIINTEKAAGNITAFFESHNIPVTGSQYEMVKEL